MNRVVSLAVLLALIALLGSTFYRVIAPFILPLFLAAVLSVICQPLQTFYLKKTAGRTAWAAGLTTVTVTLIFVGPLVVGTFLAATNLYDLAKRQLGGDWKNSLDILWHKVVMPVIERISAWTPETLTDEQVIKWKSDFSENIQSAATQLAATTFNIATSTASTFLSVAVAAGMFLTALYYFLADGPAIVAAMEELIPLPIDHQRHLRNRFARVVRAVVSATFMAAFAQGLATALALQVCGIGYFIIFLVVGSIASLIPLAGAWMVWGPCAVLLAIQGHWPAAIGLTLWGLVVVGTLDNLVKMYVLQSEADLHPLIAFISVIGALQVMGLWGIFIGPIVASCLFALIQIFNAELRQMSREREALDAAVMSRVSIPTPDPAVVQSTGVSSAIARPIVQTPKGAATPGKSHRKRRR